MANTNKFRIWINVPGRNTVELPVNPQELTISYPANPTNYDVEGLGEIIIPRKVKLRTFTIESFFPRPEVYQPLANGNAWYRPEWYVALFRDLQAAGTVFEITISRGEEEIYYTDGTSRVQQYDSTAMNAVVLDFSTTDKGGEPGDIYYSIAFSEYRDASPETLAEIASEKYDEQGRVEEQELVVVPPRTPEPDTIVAGSSVTVNGPVYASEDETDEGWQKTAIMAANVTAMVLRTLPQRSGMSVHPIYINGLGWLDKASCALNGNRNDFYSINKVEAGDV